MKFNLLERIVSIGLLDAYEEGNFVTFKTINSLKSKLLVSEEEVNKYDLKVVDNKYSWNDLGLDEVEIDVTEGEAKLLRDRLTVLDHNDKLTKQHLSIYTKLFQE